MGIWKRRKNSWIGSSGSPGIWGTCGWTRSGAVVVLMLTTAGPFCSTRALKSGRAPVADLWTCAVWACELDMVVSLPPAKPSTVAAAHTVSTTANVFWAIRISCDDFGNASWAAQARRSSRRSRPDTSCYRKTSLLLRPRGLRGLFAQQLVGTRLLQDVGALLRADPQGELDRRVAFVADHVDVRAVPEQELHHLRIAARRGVHERRIAVLGDEVGVEVLGEDLLRVDEVALLDGVEQHLDAFGALFLQFFLEPGRKQVHHVVDERKAHHGGHGDEQGQCRDAQALGHLAGHVRGDRQQHDQEEELELQVQEKRDEYDEGERAEQETPIDIEALERFLGEVGGGRWGRHQDDRRDFLYPPALALHNVFPYTGPSLFEAIIVEAEERLR